MKIKFLTLNIWHGGVLWNNLIDLIRKEKPDIAVFQEVYNGHDKTLPKRLRTMDEFGQEFDWLKDSAFGKTFFDTGANAVSGNAIFSKFEIVESKEIMFAQEYRELDLGKLTAFGTVPTGMLETKIKIGDEEIFVYSWHGVWDTHGDDTPQRDKMLEVILNSLKDKNNVILAGDTNLYPTTNFVKKLENELELKSVFGTSLGSTFNMVHKDLPGYATSAVDMIFVSQNLKIIDKYMPLNDVSDHRPLVVVLEF